MMIKSILFIIMLLFGNVVCSLFDEASANDNSKNYNFGFAGMLFMFYDSSKEERAYVYLLMEGLHGFVNYNAML